MLIPLGTDRPSHRRTVVTPALVVVNLLIFFGLAALERSNPDLAERIQQTLWLRRGDMRWYSFATYAFLHAGALHIAFNMVFLWVFGPPVEDRFGRWWFVLFYLAGGAAAGAMHVLFEEAPVVGASGAIAAVTGAFLILFPRTNIRCLWLLGASQTWVGAWWFIGFAIVFDFMMAQWSHDGIARLAHLGGYGFGAGLSFLLLATGMMAQESYDVFAMVRQAHRRRVIREAVVARDQEVARRLDPGAGGEHADELAAARAEVGRLVGAGDLAAGARAYAAMLARFTDAPATVTTMNRRLQLDLGNHAFAAGENELAATAYERFAAAYKTDPETPKVLLLAALVCTRRLGDKARGRAALDAIEGQLADADELALAEQLRAEVGPGAASGAASPLR